MRIHRRVRRRLLLPPGWVALGFLLLLGCQVLQPWKRQLRRMSVLQLTIPKLKLTAVDSENYGREYQIIYKSLAELNKFRPWHDAEFSGKALPDFFSATATESAIHEIIADTSHVGGVRVRFLAGSTYANLIQVLNIMRYTDQQKYWLDVRHRPITLYAITVERERMKNAKAPVYLGCCTCGPYLPKKEEKVAGLLKLQGLWTKPWRPTTVLLAFIGTLSLWSLLRRTLIPTLIY